MQTIWQVRCCCSRKCVCSEPSEDGGHSESRQWRRGYREALVVSIIQCPAVVLHYSSTQVFVFGCRAGVLLLSYCNIVSSSNHRWKWNNKTHIPFPYSPFKPHSGLCGSPSKNILIAQYESPQINVVYFVRSFFLVSASILLHNILVLRIKDVTIIYFYSILRFWYM